MFRFRHLTFLALSPLLAGCWLFGVDQGYQKDSISDGSYWMNYDATRRGGLLLGKDHGGKILAEPAPDAVASTAINFLAEVAAKTQDIDGKVKVDYSRAVAEMAGRSQMVLVVREALYRLNELYINGAVKEEQVADLYRGTMTAVVYLAFAAALDETGIEEAAAAQSAEVAAAESEASVAAKRVSDLRAEKVIASAPATTDDQAKAMHALVAPANPAAFPPLPAAGAKAVYLAQLDTALAQAIAKQSEREAAAAAARKQLTQLFASVEALGAAVTLLK